ncbi:MAG: hypothetical protein U0821_25280 [Chloroflexota bacterium]
MELCPARPGWTELRFPLGQPITPAPPHSEGFGRPAVSWNPSGRIYVGALGGLYRTDDCGATWFDVPTGEAIGQRTGGMPVALDRDGCLYISAHRYVGLTPYELTEIKDSNSAQNLYVSCDDGVAWRVAYLVPPEPITGRGTRLTFITRIEASATVPGLVVAFGRLRGPVPERPNTTWGSLRSCDYGLTWEHLRRGGYNFVIDPTDPEYLFSSSTLSDNHPEADDPWLIRSTVASGGFARATNLCRQGVTCAGLADLAVTADGSRMWASRENASVYVSHDLGRTWQFAFAGPIAPYQRPQYDFGLALATSPVDPRVLFVTSADARL